LTAPAPSLPLTESWRGDNLGMALVLAGTAVLNIAKADTNSRAQEFAEKYVKQQLGKEVIP
jgi:hypothetical protein